MPDEVPLWYVLCWNTRHVYGPYTPLTPLFAEKAARDACAVHQKRHEHYFYQVRHLTPTQARNVDWSKVYA